MAQRPLSRPVLKQPEAAAGERSEARAFKPLRMPFGKPAGQPAGQPAARPLRDLRPRSGLPAPQPDSLALAKAAWQPTLHWCQKEIKSAKLTDPQILGAIRQFHALVQAVLTADAAQFTEARQAAVGYVKHHPFLRWAPVPTVKPLTR